MVDRDRLVQDVVRHRSNSPTENPLFAVTYAEGQFVAVGSGTILSSSDGVNWVLRTERAFRSLYGVAYGNGTFVGTGWYGHILQSGPLDLRLEPVQLLPGGGVQGSLAGPVGEAYFVQVSTDLTNWAPLMNVFNTNATAHFFDTFVVTNTTSRFYRALAFRSNAVTSVPHLNIQQVRHARGVLVLTTHGGEIIRGYLVAGSVVFLRRRHTSQSVTAIRPWRDRRRPVLVSPPTQPTPC